MTDITPLMGQYKEIKSKYHDAVLLFRVGDFYETFYEDAVEVSRILNIALTTRDKKRKDPVPLAGVPFHAAETYISRLLAAGKKVAVCDQVENPAQAKGLVRREVVEVLTPGTAMNAQLLEDRENNFCLAVHFEDSRVGVALIDVSTGDFLCGEDEADTLHQLLQGRRIKEIVCVRNADRSRFSALIEVSGYPVVNELEDKYFTGKHAEAALRSQFERTENVGLADLRPLERTAAGAVLAHCQALRGGVLPQVTGIGRLSVSESLALDDETIGNLELFEPLRGGDPRGTLIHLLDETFTPMGAREMRDWLRKPLGSVRAIEERSQAVEELHGEADLHQRVSAVLKGIRDVQRLAARIAARKAIPREVLALREGLSQVPPLAAALGGCRSPLLGSLRNRLGDHRSLVDTIGRAVVDSPPGHLREGGVFRKGYSAELDALITKNEEAKRWISNLEKRERARTGIATLRVGFNKVFGYYIEVSKTHAKSVPEDYVPKQTLVNADRYYTEQLKEQEQLILETEEKRVECEQKLYEKLCETVANAVPEIQITSHAVAGIDVLQSLAVTARRFGYRRPIVDDSKVIELIGSRHPVIERFSREPFIPNDLFLDVDKRQFALITGPNMSGKSTFLRQVGLIVVLAQMGSFVPAERAKIGLVDQIFTRVGASDRLSRGESTFLVEMKETANILSHITDRSLVLLDEVGRGTSTYDGLSIAWAVTEYLLQGMKARPKTLFATHYHELSELRRTYPRLVNLKISIKEWEGGVVFLRKIVPGTSDRSYGIHAGRVAGLPAPVLKRAEEILRSLEAERERVRDAMAFTGPPEQYHLFQVPPDAKAEGGERRNDLSDLAERLAGFDVDASTPLEALQFVKLLKDLSKG